MAKVPRPLLARQRWDSALDEESYYRTHYQAATAEWRKKQNSTPLDPKVPSQVDRILSLVRLWPLLERKIFWARVRGMKWASIQTVIVARQLTKAECKAIYDQQILQLSKLLPNR